MQDQANAITVNFLENLDEMMPPKLTKTQFFNEEHSRRVYHELTHDQIKEYKDDCIPNKKKII